MSLSSYQHHPPDVPDFLALLPGLCQHQSAITSPRLYRGTRLHDSPVSTKEKDICTTRAWFVVVVVVVIAVVIVVVVVCLFVCFEEQLMRIGELGQL